MILRNSNDVGGCRIRVAKTVSAGSAGGTSAASSEKPAWLINLRTKGLGKRAQDAIKKEMDVLKRSGVFKPLKKAVKLIPATECGVFIRKDDESNVDTVVCRSWWLQWICSGHQVAGGT